MGLISPAWRARLSNPTVAAVLVACLLTAAWVVLERQVSIPRGFVRAIYTGASPVGPALDEATVAAIDLDGLPELVAAPEGPRMLTVRWEGYWVVAADQRVSLRVRTDSRADVIVDGVLVLQHDATVVPTRATTRLPLTAGTHQVVVIYAYDGRDPELRVQWAPPGGQPRPLPRDLVFARRLDARSVFETRLVERLGWLVGMSWGVLPLIPLLPVARRTLASLTREDVRRRLRVVAGPALLAPLQIFLFGTHEIYVGNITEFSAPYWSLTGHWLPALTAVVATLMALGLVLPEVWFARYVVLLFAGGVMTWVQGNILVVNYGPFDGQALDWTLHAGRAPYEVGLWLAALAGLVAASRRLFPLAPFGSQLLVALQLIVLVGAQLRAGTELTPRYTDRPDFLFELSRTRNVIHLVLDGFQSDVFREILDNDPTLAGDLSGFVFFADHAGAFRTTILSIPAMLTGAVYRNQQPLQAFIDGRPARPSLITTLQEHGYDTDALSIHQPGLTAATNFYKIPRPYVGYGPYTRFAAWQLVDLSLFRHAPHVVKPWIHNDENWRLQVMLGQRGNPATTERRHHPENGQAVLDDLIRLAQVNRDEPVYKFVHVGIPHLPVVLDDECVFIGITRATRAAYRGQATCAVTLVRRLLDRLRALQIYDDSVLIVSSDHGVRLPPRGFVDDRPLPFVDVARMAGNAHALLAIKAAGARGPLRVSDAPTSITDIPATVADLLGLEALGFTGEPALRLADDAPRERVFAWYPWDEADWNSDYLGRMDLFAIDGRVNDRAAWTYRGMVVPPGTDVAALAEGWDQTATVGGSDQRVVTERATVFSPPGSRFLRLAMTSVVDQTRVTVLVNGEEIDRLVVDPSQPRSREYPLRVSPERVSARVDFQVELTSEQPPGPRGDAPAVVLRDVEWR